MTTYNMVAVGDRGGIDYRPYIPALATTTLNTMHVWRRSVVIMFTIKHTGSIS